MRFGVFTVSTPEYSLKETVELLKRLGYDGVEWRVQSIPKEVSSDVPFELRYWGDNKSTIDIEKVEEIVPEVKEMCDAAELEIFGLTTYLRPHEFDAIEKVLRAAKHNDIKFVRVFPPDYPDPEGKKTFPQLWKETYDNIRKLETLAKQYGVKIIFEIHHDNLIASPSAAYSFVNGCNPDYIGLIFDPGNMVYEGFENYQKSFELLGPYVAHVHVKNAILVPDKRDEFQALKFKRDWASLRNGSADLAYLFEVLKAMEYNGTVSVEDFSNDVSTEEKLADNIKYIRQLASS
ncbi:MAG TPA: sugar phosphate isomerase/epimerase [Sphaerochaeta sp.]|nr:sugar phosphate isomerase/epimerase [Sphaerochaeta sp.]